MSHSQRTILVIDDSPEDRELYRRYLLLDKEYHYTILEAELGQEGLELWQRYQPDAVLLDYRLPDIEGLELLAHMPHWTQQPCLPVIVVTGQGNEAIAVQAMKAGAQDYLLKGQITPESLRLAVNGAIETVQLRTQLQQRIERERLLAQITRLLHQSLDLDTILQTTVTQVRQFLQTDRVLIFRLQKAGWGKVVTESVGTDWTPLLSTTHYDPCLDERYIEPFRQGLVTIKSDIYDGSIEPCHVELLAQLQVKANLVVPILQKDQLWGMLIAHHCSTPRQWQPLEIDLLKELATQVGIALQQAELYQQARSELAQRQRAESALEIALAQLEQRAAALAENNESLQTAMEELEIAEEELRTQNDELAIAQENVERQRQRYQELFELAPDGYLLTNDRGIIQEANQAAQALLKSDLKHLIGSPLIEFIPESEHQAFCNQIERWLTDRLNTSRSVSTWELNLQPFRGRPFPAEISLTGGCYLEGEPNSLRWLLRDITSRQQAEVARRQSEERYRTLAELIPQLVWTASGEGMLLDVNQRWSDFTGLTLTQAQTSGWQAVVHPDDVPILSQQWAEAVTNGTQYQAEGRIRRADGVYRWHLHQAMPQRNKQGQVTKWFGTATDIELQKRMEVERDRLLKLEQAARAEAERANRVKDEFLAILSHELRSPLNPILGWTKLLQTRKFDEAKTAEALATIERNAKLQTKLIDDLLDVARILRGKLTVNAAPVNLVFVIEAAIETVQTAAVAKSILIQPVLPNIGQVSGDSARLQQIFWNLLSNAIKFTPTGGRIGIRLERVGNQAQITVADNGIGISPDFLPHIFEYFRQEDASITRKHGGLGLGLAIVYHLIEAHGGTVTATSPGVGQGATFTVRLPLLGVEPNSARYDSLDSELNLKGIRVLLVDDEPDTRELLAFMLLEYGAEAMVVASAGEVLALLESFKPDILVSDIGMPEVDGYTLLKQVRSLSPERGGLIRAIALTAYARAEDQQKAEQAGFQRHISKPVDPVRLIAAISDLASMTNNYDGSISTE